MKVAWLEKRLPIMYYSVAITLSLWTTTNIWTNFLIEVILCYVQRPPKLSIGPPHPDPIVETASLSAAQPPEPTYNLRIKDDLERSKALSCLQIETLVYACQVALTIWHAIFFLRFSNIMHSYFFLHDRDIFSTFLAVRELDFFLEMVLVWVKEGQLLG